jgi:hypothetical protein
MVRTHVGASVGVAVGMNVGEPVVPAGEAAHSTRKYPSSTLNSTLEYSVCRADMRMLEGYLRATSTTGYAD